MLTTPESGDDAPSTPLRPQSAPVGTSICGKLEVRCLKFLAAEQMKLPLALRKHPLNLSGRFIQIAFHCISDICKVSLTFWHFLTTELAIKWFCLALFQVLFRCAMEFSILILHRNSPRPFMPSPRATSSVFGWLDVVRQLKTWTIFGDEMISEKLGKLLICSSTLTRITAGDDLTSSRRDPVTSSFGPPTVCCKASSKAFTYQRIGNGWDNVELVMSFGGKWEASWGKPQVHLTSSNHTQHMMWPTSLIGPHNKKPAVSNLLHDCFSTLAENSRQVLQGNQQNQWLQCVKEKSKECRSPQDKCEKLTPKFIWIKKVHPHHFRHA